jgi:putative membrane protein
MKKQLVRALIAAPAALAALPAAAQTPAYRPDYMHWGWEWGWGHMAFGSIMMLLFWGGFVVAFVLAARWIGSDSAPGALPTASSNKAIDLLRERFARGEIDKAEFEERKRILSN